MLAMGVLLAVIERQRSNLGQVIDVAMMDGASYVALPLFKWLQPGGILPTTDDGRLDVTQSILHQAAPWGDTYECKCGGWFAVQALEPQFYREMLHCLGLRDDDPSLPARSDTDAWPELRSRFADIFRTKTRDEWEVVFRGTDACGAPVLSTVEAAKHPHAVARGSFAPTPGMPGLFEPVPAPWLGRTPGYLPRPRPTPGGNTAQVLAENGFSDAEIGALLRNGDAVDTSTAGTARL